MSSAISCKINLRAVSLVAGICLNHYGHHFLFDHRFTSWNILTQVWQTVPSLLSSQKLTDRVPKEYYRFSFSFRLPIDGWTETTCIIYRNIKKMLLFFVTRKLYLGYKKLQVSKCFVCKSCCWGKWQKLQTSDVINDFLIIDPEADTFV